MGLLERKIGKGHATLLHGSTFEFSSVHFTDGSFVQQFQIYDFSFQQY